MDQEKSLQVQEIEEALDKLLNAVEEVETRFPPAAGKPLSISWILDSSWRERELSYLTSDPVGFSLRAGVNKLRQHLYRLLGGIDRMQDSLERVVSLDETHLPRRMVVLTYCWNGIGDGDDMWVA